MERKDVIKMAETLGLTWSRNIKTTKLLKMVEEKVERLNANLKPVEKKEKIFCGVSPLTGEKIYR